MGNIVLLDDLTINKIAAGEVIERPANVVKELVENSIDAGAKNIIIEIKNGGKTLIKIIDNGSGIATDDMLISLERHATSKIRKVEDLEKIYSMGFRGEALASIASISRLTMISKTKDANFGTKLVCEGGDIIEQEEIGCQTGTTMIVENLFFNTPVRFKFLKQDSTEAKYIKEFVQKVSLAHPDIVFELIENGKITFKSVGNGKIEDLVYLLYGKDIKENIVKVDYEEDGIKVEGVIGNTLVAEKSRKNQIVFLNKRNIRNPILTNSGDQAFKASIGIGKYGFFILNLSMKPDMYDINVHPTKMEVRFRDEGKIYSIFYHAIKSAMLNKEFLGNNEDEIKKQEYVDNEYNFVTNHFQKAPTEFSNRKIYSQVELINREKVRNVDYKFIGILFKTYILIQIDNDLFFVDQHAAHERVLYEQVKANYKANVSNNTQLMLMPDIINLTHKEIEFVKENMDIIKKLGFDIEIFGDTAVKLNGIPDVEYKANKKDFFVDVLDTMLENERGAIKDIEERFVATVACKAAVKAKMDLTRQEVDSLLQSLLKLQNPYTCPHGRPTTVKISKEELLRLDKKIN